MNWDELRPEGRTVFYEGDDPDRFIAEMRDIGIEIDLDSWEEFDFSFSIPPGRVEEVYGSGRWHLGS